MVKFGNVSYPLDPFAAVTSIRSSELRWLTSSWRFSSPVKDNDDAIMSGGLMEEQHTQITWISVF
jgi:hypothetical protein